MKNIENEIQNETSVSNTALDKTKNNIFLNLEENKLALFSSKENRWIQKTDALFNSVLNVLQKTKIEEAESVTVVIKADCVNKYSKDNVADTVHSILGTKGHEQQRIKIELRCLSVNRPNQEEHLSNTLIDQLKNLNRASIYGKEPSVVIHMALKEFEDEVKSKLKVGQLYALYESGQATLKIFDAEDKAVKTPIEAIKSAEEVSLQVNCDSNFESEISRNLPTICGLSPTELAQSVKKLFSDIDGSVLDKKRIELRLYACNSGTTIGKKYVGTFLDTLKNLYKKHIIDEVLSFVGWIMQENKKVTTAVPTQLKFCAEDILQNKYPEELKALRDEIQGNLGIIMWPFDREMFAREHVIYGRFTVRTKWDGTKYITFPVLPATEYGVYKVKNS
ncbi:hypothetical protein ANANG_G00115310 [Anguilla anguilla]|uniref:Uncharacterized protein n=1 Tax=Anguilla anguilla TaxID=7936 RepID=A0A9D3ME98_ANGAN|nr:hypothetical protein ANANG_G00115310 [Anguilla anguilla]